MENFKLYSQYYDLLYQDKATRQECQYVYNKLERPGKITHNWLEFGAGSGRHGKIFSDLGVNWRGIELSKDMAMQGQEQSLSIDVGDIRNHCVAEEAFDAVLSLFHVVSYLTQNEDLIATFKNAHRHLKKGGSFFFDTWYTPAVLTQLPAKRTKEVENTKIAVHRTATPTIQWNHNTINVHYLVRVTDKESRQVEIFEENHLMRHLSVPEVLLFANLTGFKVVHFEEWMSGKAPGPDTWGVAFLLEKL